MRIIAKRTLIQYGGQYPEAMDQLIAWHTVVRSSTWQNPAEVKQTFAKASIVTSERVVFNICGGRFRLIVAIDYERQIVFVKFFGTHAEYDKIDVATIDIR